MVIVTFSPFNHVQLMSEQPVAYISLKMALEPLFKHVLLNWYSLSKTFLTAIIRPHHADLSFRQYEIE